MTETPYDELIQDLHAMCDRGFRCHILSNISQMCVTCQAAQNLYLCYRQNIQLRQLHAEWVAEKLSPEMTEFHDDLVAGCYGAFPSVAPSQ